MSTPDLAPRDPSRLSRRQLLQASGLTLGALAVGRHAYGQTPKEGARSSPPAPPRPPGSIRSSCPPSRAARARR
jgi:hypothetical protein